MKRKDWKIKKLKKDIFGKNKKVKRIRERFLFLRKLFLRQNRYLTKKNLIINYLFYKSFLNLNKLKKQNYFFNLFFKANKNYFCFLPEYSIVKNVFNKKIKFKKIKQNYQLKVVFLSNKYIKNNFGLSFYLIDKGGVDFINFIKELEDDNNQNLIHFKNTNTINSDYIHLNYYFNFNIHILQILEIYKILIFINLNEFK